MLGGCGESKITEHRVAKGIEKFPERANKEPTASELSTYDAETETMSFPWTTPSGWVLDAEPRPMRLATYRIPDGDQFIELAVTRFAGRVGGERANVNRWRTQMGLGPIADADLDDALVRFQDDSIEGYEIRIESDSGVMLASGVYEVDADRTWFVRVTTKADSADRVQSAVFGFARSMLGVSTKDSN